MTDWLSIALRLWLPAPPWAQALEDAPIGGLRVHGGGQVWDGSLGGEGAYGFAYGSFPDSIRQHFLRLCVLRAKVGSVDGAGGGVSGMDV